GLKIAFYGGKPEVIEKIIARAKIDFPSLEISYAHSPPFRPLTDIEDAEAVEKINSSGTQILFVGLGCPKGERWMAEHRDRIDAVMLGVGAAFDFYAGTLSEAPQWMRKSGLEWLFRLSSEPSRLWKRYLYTNSRFMLLAARQRKKS
ncbi:MAG TPA: WecB/TagA/CpsF family glycosyltransferase, partial [Pyrinomonadaceae bacterium]|nr:WecB/TagA/CpsF family glycosyltransferase [Pyrinomonadaceae bacterium]